MQLNPHQERVIVEYADLCDKVAKLAAFLSTPTFWQLSFLEQELLREQIGNMTGYQTTLRKRLSLWGVEHATTGNGTVLVTRDGQPVRSQHSGTPQT